MTIVNKSHSIQLLTALAEEGKNVFTTDDARQLSKNLNIPNGYVPNLLMLMVKNGMLTRLRRGIYARTGPVLGNNQIHSFAIATQLVVPSAISHWSALNHHGLTEQVPHIVTAFTTKKVVTPSMRNPENKNSRGHHAWVIDNIRYEYITVKKKYFFGIENIWLDEFTQIPITDRERTMLELFISSRNFGGINEAIGIIQEHFNTLNFDKMVEYACMYGKISVAKRLGWTLENAGVQESVVKSLLDINATGYHLLDPARPREGSYDKKWMIQNNLGIEQH